MITLECTKRCLKFGLLRKVGESMNVGTKAEAEPLVSAGNWKIVNETPDEEPKAKAKGAKRSADPFDK